MKVEKAIFLSNRKYCFLFDKKGSAEGVPLVTGIGYDGSKEDAGTFY